MAAEAWLRPPLYEDIYFIDLDEMNKGLVTNENDEKPLS